MTIKVNLSGGCVRRFLFLIGILWSCGDPLLAQTVPADGAAPWYRRLRVGIEWGPTGANEVDGVYLSQITGQKIIQNQRLANSQYAVVFMKDMEYAYYNSKLARKCPNLGDRDVLRECLDEARKYDMPVVAYCQVQYDSSSWRAHPEWRMKGPDGKDLDSRLCYNSGYVEQIKGFLAEMMEYEISGFHVDMLDFGFFAPYGCWCDTCRKQFREQNGIDMPAGPTWDEAWDKMLEFRYRSNVAFCKQVQEFVKSRKPNMSIDFNYHGYPPFAWEVGERPVSHAAVGDFVTAEGLPFVFGQDNPSMLALFLAAARPGGPVQVASSRTMHGYHDFNIRPLAELKWEVFTYLAHGAQCTIVDKANYDGTLDPVAYRRLGEVFGEAIAKGEYFGHTPVAEVGLYFSSRSRDWYGRDDRVKYMAAFWGAHKALKQSQITQGMILDENVTAERLRAFPVVYLPGVAVLSDREVELLESYVRDGGNLLVTGMTGVCDRYGQPQKTSALERLIGARLVRCVTEYPDNYLRLPSDLKDGDCGFLLRDVPADWPMLSWSPLVAYEPTEAKGVGQAMIAYRSQSNQWAGHMSPEKSIGPAILLHRLGKGKVLCVAGCPDAAYVGQFRMPEHRYLIRNMIRNLNPEPLVRVDAPPQVEVVVARDSARKRLLVHFLSHFGAPSSAGISFDKGTRVLPSVMEEELPFSARIHVSVPIRKASVAGADSSVKPCPEGLRLDTPRCHEVLILDLQ